MKTIRFWSALALALQLVGIASAHAAPLERRLGNGLAVQVTPDRRVPLVRLQLLIPAGSALDPKDQSGVASVAAELLKQGTPTRDARAIRAGLDNMSATLTITLSRDHVLLQGAFLAADLEPAIELLSDVAIASLLDDEHVLLARQSAMRAIAQFRQNPANLAEDHLWKSVFEGHGYGSPRLGTLAAIDRIKTEQVRAFHLANYVPARSVLSFSGDLDADRAFAMAERWFGRWTDRSAGAAAAPPAGGTTRTGVPHLRLVDRPDMRTAEIRIGFAGPARGAADELAFALAGGILGSSPGSRVSRLAAAKQVGADARTYLLQMRNGSLLAVGASAAPESAAAVTRKLMDELRRLASDPPSDAEVAAVARYASRTWPIQLDPPAARMLQWGMSSFSGLSQEYVPGYGSRVAAVDPAAVRSAIAKWLAPGSASLVVVGPAATLEPGLAAFGTVEKVEAEALEPGGSAPQAAAVTQAPTRDQIDKGRKLARQAADAHGGLAKLRAITDSDVEGDMTFLLQGREIAGKMRQIRKDPYRMVYTTTLAEIATHQTLNGNQAWSIAVTGDAEPREADSLAVRGLRNGFSSDLPHLLLGAQDAASEVFLRGRDSVESRPVDALVVRTPAGDRRVLYLDARSHRLVAMDQQDAESGSAFASRRIYRDYRPVNGVQWPWAEDRYLGGEQVMKVRYTRVGLNTGVGDAAFERPEPALPPHSR